MRLYAYQMLYNSNDYAFVDDELSTLIPGYSKKKPIVVAHEYMRSIQSLQEDGEGDNILELAIMEQAKGATLPLVKLDELKERPTDIEQSSIYVPTSVNSLKEQALDSWFCLKAKPVYMNISVADGLLFVTSAPANLYLPHQ